MRIKMTDYQVLECCESVLDFLNEDIPMAEVSALGFRTPCSVRMTALLNAHGFDSMVEFTELLNKHYNLGYKLQDDMGYKTFFTNESRGFYKSIIRNLKINEVIG